MRRVLEVAGRVFAEQGFHDVSMDDVATAAGVSKPVVYTHFESKDGLYEAVVLHATDEFATRMRESVVPAESAEERMWNGIVAFADAVEEHPEWWLLIRQAANLTDPLLAGVATRAHDANSELIAMLFSDTANLVGLGGAESTIEPLAHACVGACAAMADWWIAHPEVPKGTVAITLMNMMWMGFGDLVEANVWIPLEAR